MPIDPSIALNARPIQLPDIQNIAVQFAQMRNYMSQEAQRARELREQNTLRGLLSLPDANPDDPAFLRKVMTAAPNIGPDWAKNYQASKEQRLKAEAEQLALKQARQLDAARQLTGMRTREQALTSLTASRDRGDITPEGYDAIMTELPADDAGMPQFVQGMLYRMLKPEDATQTTNNVVDTGQTTQVVQTPSHMGSGIAPTIARQFTNTATPGQVMSDNTQRRGQDITATTAANSLAAQKAEAEAKLNAPQPLPGEPGTFYTPDGRLFIGGFAPGAAPVPSVYGNAMGGAPAAGGVRNAMVPQAAPPAAAQAPVAAPAPARPAPTSVTGAKVVTTEGLEGKTLPEVKEAMSSRQALASLGYGSPAFNDVENMIKASTNGQLDKSFNDVKGAVGQSGPEAQAIQKLTTLTGRLIMAATQGKLGSGISNADVDLLKSMLGDISNPALPTSTRLEAWKQYVRNTERSANYASGDLTVTLPDGRSVTFPDAAKRDAFKAKAGLP